MGSAIIAARPPKLPVFAVSFLFFSGGTCLLCPAAVRCPPGSVQQSNLYEACPRALFGVASTNCSRA